MVSAVELAERKAQARALVFLVFAAASVLVLLISFGPGRPDFLRGLWLGITTGAAINLLPLGRLLKPRSAVARLLDDESTREHRHLSCVAGFWAAMAAGVVMAMLTADGGAITAFDTARVIATAAIGAALTSFALLELRAARG